MRLQSKTRRQDPTLESEKPTKRVHLMRASPPLDGGESHMEPRVIQEEGEDMVEKTSVERFLDKSMKMRKCKREFRNKS